MSAKLCIKCNKNEKVGYKYCNECKDIANREKANARRRAHTAKSKVICIECKTNLCTSKYCRSCARIVSIRKSKEQYEKTRKKKNSYKAKGTYVQGYKVKIAKKFLVRGNIHAYSSSDAISNGA